MDYGASLANAATGNDDDTLCPAQRIDIKSLRKQSDWQVYLVRASKAMRLQDLDFEYADTSDISDEKSNTYISLVTSKDKLQSARFRKVICDKPIRAMVNAINSLRDPPSAPMTISEGSKKAANYLLRSETDESVNLFEKFPGLVQVRDGTTPEFVMDAYSKLDKSKQDAFRNLGDTPDGMAIIPGVAACGKTLFMMFIILALYFGACGSDARPGKAERDKRRVLWCKFYQFFPSLNSSIRETWLTCKFCWI